MIAADEIARRIERFRQVRDPSVIWPDVPAAAVHRSLDEITRVSAALLARTPTPIRLLPPPDVSPTAFGVAAFMSGMGPLLGYWREQGLLLAPDGLATLLAVHLDHGRRRAARLRDELESILAAFGEHGIPVLVLKGGHTAYRYFPEPGTRPATDIDVLLRPLDIAPAGRLLHALGFTEVDTFGLPHRSHWARPARQTVASLEVAHADNPWSLDVHASLDRPYSPGVLARFGNIDFSRGEPWDGLSRPTLVLRQPLLTAYLACNASGDLANLSLLRLAELVLVAQRDFGTAQAWGALEALLADTRTERFAFPSLELAERFVPGTLPPDVRARLAARTPARLRRRVARTTPASAQSLKPLPWDEKLIWAASPREYGAYLLHLVWPYTLSRPSRLRDAVANQGRRLRRVLHSLLLGKR